MTATSPHDDPRLSTPADDGLSLDGGDPVVGREAGRSNVLLIGGVFVLVAIMLFLWLNGSRLERQNRLLTTPISNSDGAGVSAAPPLVLPPTPAAAPVAPAPQFTTDNSAPPPPPPAIPAAGAAPPATGENDVLARRRAPAVVVELGEGGAQLTGNAVMPGSAAAGATEVPAPGAVAGAAAMGAAVGTVAARGLDSEGDGAGGLSGDEQFAARVTSGQPERARATTLRNLSTLAPQGTIITGVLETAINSDLPGYTRAVVSRDVRSFDGKQVLIPRGSRLIGQYKSAVALGQSRAFVIWTRVIRPDGVSIQIASPGGDSLGRGGMTGDVDRHFFRRFGGSILLSVLNAGVASVGQTASTQISIGSPAAAAGAAAQATLGENIPPTIKVPQGEAIRIFVARDLDFSGVATVR